MKIDENNRTNPAYDNAGTYKTDKAKSYADKKIRDEGVKRGIIITALISFVILLVAGIIVFSHNSNEHKKLLNLMEMQKTSLTEQVTTRDSVISNWISTFDDIEKNIAMIKEKERVITINSSNSELSKDKRLQVVEDIKYINTLLQQNKQKIASLNAQLKKSGGTMKVLESKISDLEASVKQNETEIADLKTSLVNKKFEVEQLSAEKIVLQDTISRKDEKISNQTYEMNKAFYTCGTYKELKAKGLLAKEGGFIGLGKTKSLTGKFPENSFIQIDITQLKSIPVNSKGAKLITEHVAGSYEVIFDKDKKVVSIDITNPAEFWKVSKYAVVETK